MSWTVIRFWGKDIMKDVDKCVKEIEDTIFEIMLERNFKEENEDELDIK